MEESARIGKVLRESTQPTWKVYRVSAARSAVGERGLPDSELSLSSSLDQTKKKKQKLSLLASRYCRICSSLLLMRISRSSRAQ